MFVKQKLEEYASVHSASVSKILPDTIRINIVPEVPLAIVNALPPHHATPFAISLNS